MRILKIMLLSTALAAFGAMTAVAQPAQAATTGEDTAKPKTTTKKASTKKTATAKKKTVKAKKPTTKKVAAKAKKKPGTSADTETAPGNPPPGSTSN